MKTVVRGREEIPTLKLGADSTRILLKGSDTNNTFSILEYTMAPLSQGPEIHIHDEFSQTFVVTSGCVTFSIDENETKIGVGGVVFVPRGTPHTVRNCTEELATYLIVFTPSGFEDYFLAVSNDLTEQLDHTSLLAKYGERRVTKLPTKK
jgi:mannose-6-phosphate isomerase-like protein (cupin superfamily)